MSRPASGARRWSRALVVLGAVAVAVSGAIPAAAAPVAGEPAAERRPSLATGTFDAPTAAGFVANGFEFREPPAAPCADPTINGFLATYFVKGECLRIRFTIPGTPAASGKQVDVELVGPDGGAPFATIDAVQTAADRWTAVRTVGTTWPSGRITARVTMVGETDVLGDAQFFVNQLGASVEAASGVYAPGAAIPVSGNIAQLNDVAGATERTGVPATFKLRVTDPVGDLVHESAVLTAAALGPNGGDFSYEIPAGATAGLTAGPETGFKIRLALTVADASYEDALGTWVGRPAGTGQVDVVAPPSTLLLENSFVSSRGWVKPNETYPFRVFVRNHTASSASDVQVTIPAPDGTTFTDVTTLGGSGSASIGGGGAVTWDIGSMTAAAAGVPDVATLVVEAKADSLAQDAEIVWKDLSATATLTYTGGPGGGISDEAHGPKVIPPGGGFETARYGDKRFPMVPVDYRDRKHDPDHDGAELSRVVNSPDFAGSTYNLYQEMSFGQLHPFGSVPSVGIASADFEYEHGFEFSQYEIETEEPKPTCRGTTLGNQEAVYGTPLYPERINDGWYQLPGDTEYYGGDYPAFSLGVTGHIDDACGDTSKSVYDAAVIADPEIDYNDYDFDKDGVVDFFMMVFVGLGGNGDSQINGAPPYDNIWPHSSSLEFSYQDDATGLQGYISDDPLTDLAGTPQCWTDGSYTVFDACAASGGSGQDDKPVYVRVGPYNVNPESAIGAASVISHEFGHHLGLPDFYSTSYEAYENWNLMASDYSQHMTTFAKQDLGWVVPQFLQPGQTVNVDDWEEIKNDTGQIRWQRPDGTFYTLSAADGDQNVHNGQAYGLKLPRRQVIDPAKVPSGSHVWYSERGNDFGCTPLKGHNLDIRLDELGDLAPGAEVTLRFKSSWDIEWDWDYGFVMITTDGRDYTSLPSENGYTTDDSNNPNGIGCQDDHDNGITGQSGAYQAGPAQVAAARAPNSPTAYSNGSPFLEDEYDLSAYAGQDGVVLRFSYFTDPAFDRPGWFIDDIAVTSGLQTLYASDFEQDDELRIFPGGCGDEGMRTATKCTAGWSRISASQGAPQDHGYYLELRDRSGFDYDGKGQSDRGAITWAPGALIEYTDESRGYGNNGGGMPPRQHYIDSQPTPGADCGDGLVTTRKCGNAAFTAAAGDTHFDDDPASPTGCLAGDTDPVCDWEDNFEDDSEADGHWHFDHDCLSLDVHSMSNPADSRALPSNLTADATITALAKCSRFSYAGNYPNARPDAVAEARPAVAAPGQPITFDGSGSSDDRQTPEELTYRWDFTNDGSYDATGQVVTRAYGAPGTYVAKLQVTDANGASDTALVTVRVRSLPDLDVTKVTLTNVRTENGWRVRFTATIKNIGDARAGQSYTTFNLDDRSVGNPGVVLTPALAPGTSTTVSKNWNARRFDGAHELRIFADYRKQLAEENERNNGLRKRFTTDDGRVVR